MPKDEKSDTEKEEYSDDIYAKKGREALVEAGEISAEEEGFMSGEESEGECAYCGVIIGEDDNAVKKEVDGNTLLFCCKACAKNYDEEG